MTVVEASPQHLHIAHGLTLWGVEGQGQTQMGSPEVGRHHLAGKQDRACHAGSGAHLMLLSQDPEKT